MEAVTLRNLRGFSAQFRRSECAVSDGVFMSSEKTGISKILLLLHRAAQFFKCSLFDTRNIATPLM